MTALVVVVDMIEIWSGGKTFGIEKRLIFTVDGEDVEWLSVEVLWEAYGMSTLVPR